MALVHDVADMKSHLSAGRWVDVAGRQSTHYTSKAVGVEHANRCAGRRNRDPWTRLGAEGAESAAQKRPLIRNRQTRGLLKQLYLDRALTAEGGLTTVSYAKTAC